MQESGSGTPAELLESCTVSMCPFFLFLSDVCAQKWSQDCRLAELRLERTLICTAAASGSKLFLILDPHRRPLGGRCLLHVASLESH